MVKYKMSAVIPCVQYGNISPEIELEGEDISELHETAMKHVKEVWARYSEKPLVEKESYLDMTVELTSFNGEKILYNDKLHKYYDINGNELMSGSVYAAQFAKPFEKDKVLPYAAKKAGISEEELSRKWDLLASISGAVGTAIHGYMELLLKFGLNDDTGKYIPEAMDAIVANVYKIVSGSAPELLISHTASGRVGRVDAIRFSEDNRSVHLYDYKTNRELTKEKIEVYRHQLNFYAEIMANWGYKIDGMTIIHITPTGNVVPIELEYIATL